MTESDLRTIFGQNIKKFRIIKGLSQAKLAESLDISSNFISDMETGKRWLSSDTLVNLAKVLNVEAYELLRPSHLLTDDKQEFIRKYTERAVEITSDAVVSSLNKLYDLHLDDKL